MVETARALRDGRPAAEAVAAMLAEAAGLRPAAGDTPLNLAVDLASVGGTAFGWRNEVKARDARLRRLSAGAAIAALRVQLLTKEGAACVPQKEGSCPSAPQKGKVIVSVRDCVCA